VRTRSVKNRVALALRLAAHSLHHADNYLGEFSRRMKRKLGPAQAITATAHKLARIVFHLLKTHEPYDETVFQKQEVEAQKRAESRLRRQATQLGFQVIPVTPEQA
jgi:transposase